jgi:hypothetical protein
MTSRFLRLIRLAIPTLINANRKMPPAKYRRVWTLEISGLAVKENEAYIPNKRLNAMPIKLEVAELKNS